MTATVLKFRRPATPRRESKRVGGTLVTGFAVTLEARPGSVVFTADGIQLGFSSAQARELATELLECADDSDSCGGEPGKKTT